MRHANPGLDPETALTDWNQATIQTADAWMRYECELVTTRGSISSGAPRNSGSAPSRARCCSST